MFEKAETRESYLNRWLVLGTVELFPVFPGTTNIVHGTNSFLVAWAATANTEAATLGLIKSAAASVTGERVTPCFAMKPLHQKQS